ncbi:alpha/beta hydrolase [Shewanella litorisediminis]|uniref:Alpha/beta hydrolase n=1 Tax=Shewanella litorisediminis TaxID=1173586 RepID=A0ABX7G1N1_9GAMM|nr:alpha/beta hydrolase [Shewanella litorisediminis]MCL2918402.1 alpha/beta hydrolase [Shewanella litorisediminis]QRH01240.1 alpha/beta hydrolase [Shewanella litorisediminis]
MASWQAKVLNSVLSYIAKPGMHARGTRLSLADIRRRLLALDSRYLAWPKGLVSENLSLSHSCLIHYRLEPGAAPTPRIAIFYVRGGGFCFKTPNAHGRFIADLCRELDADAYVPDYRLAPEHPFPAPLEDVLEGYERFLSRWSGPFVVMGDSAGGNLAMSLLLQVKEKGLRLPGCAVLLSPALDLGITGNSERLLSADDPLFSIESLLRLRGAYLQGANPMDVRASPLHGDLHGMPPMLLLAGTRELLLEDSERMALRLRESGAEVEQHFLAHMPHVFPLFEILPEAREAREFILEFIQRRLM